MPWNGAEVLPVHFSPEKHKQATGEKFYILNIYNKNCNILHVNFS